MYKVICILLLFVVSEGIVVGKSTNETPFVTVRLKEGRLGNQYFMIAAAVSLALDHEAEAVFPWLDSVTTWGVPINREKIFHRCISRNIPKTAIKYKYVSKKIGYAPITYKPNMEMTGYFQSEKYFRHHKQEILELFAPSQEILDNLTTNYIDIINHPNSVSVHLRNYLPEDPTLRYCYTLPRSYYKQAIAMFPEDTLFVVSSNDILWAKDYLKGIQANFYFIENEKYYNEIYLMGLCKHHIIANSSFSWWASYMNRNENKVIIAPNKWFVNPNSLPIDDIIPPEWIVIDVD